MASNTYKNLFLGKTDLLELKDPREKGDIFDEIALDIQNPSADDNKRGAAAIKNWIDSTGEEPSRPGPTEGSPDTSLGMAVRNGEINPTETAQEAFLEMSGMKLPGTTDELSSQEMVLADQWEAFRGADYQNGKPPRQDQSQEVAELQGEAPPKSNDQGGPEVWGPSRMLKGIMTLDAKEVLEGYNECDKVGLDPLKERPFTAMREQGKQMGEVVLGVLDDTQHQPLAQAALGQANRMAGAFHSMVEESGLPQSAKKGMDLLTRSPLLEATEGAGKRGIQILGQGLESLGIPGASKTDGKNPLEVLTGWANGMEDKLLEKSPGIKFAKESLELISDALTGDEKAGKKLDKILGNMLTLNPVERMGAINEFLFGGKKKENQEPQQEGEKKPKTANLDDESPAAALAKQIAALTTFKGAKKKGATNKTAGMAGEEAGEVAEEASKEVEKKQGKDKEAANKFIDHSVETAKAAKNLAVKFLSKAAAGIPVIGPALAIGINVANAAIDIAVDMTKEMAKESPGKPGESAVSQTPEPEKLMGDSAPTQKKVGKNLKGKIIGKLVPGGENLGDFLAGKAGDMAGAGIGKGVDKLKEKPKALPGSDIDYADMG